MADIFAPRCVTTPTCTREWNVKARTCCSQHAYFNSAIEHQAAEAVRDLALAELDLPAGAAAVTAKLVPLLQWSTISYDQAHDQVQSPFEILER